MALKDFFKINRKTFFSPSSWLGFQDLKETTLGIINILKGIFLVPKGGKKETFNEAKARLHLTEADIKETETNYFFYALLFLGCSIIAFIGGIAVLIKYYSISGLILAWATSAIFLTQAFRNHFLYFQIKVRKLGCTYKEWKRFTFPSLGAKE